MICNNCKHRIPDGSKKCPVCGQEIGVSKKTQPVKEKQSKKSGAASATIKIIATVCAVLMIALAVVGGKTGIFKENDGDKTVILTGFNADQKASFSEFINKFSVYFENGYNYETDSFEKIIGAVQPKNPGGLYRSFLGQPHIVSDRTDPAGRFPISETVAGYVEVPSDDIDLIAESLAQNMLIDENSESCYYWDNNFYFRISDTDEFGAKLYATIYDSKKTSLGDYYCKLNIYNTPDALVDESNCQPLYQRYAVVMLEETETTMNWTLKRISEKPLYADSGSRIQDEIAEGSIEYVLEHKKYEAKTSDGVVFAKYYIEYPRFEESGIAQAACESVYSSQIEEFKTKMSNADSFLETYKSSGGNEDLLPLYTNVIVSVTYNENGTFSVIERLTDFNPIVSETPATDEQITDISVEEVLAEQSSTQTKVILPTITYTGYTFKIETGEFVKKEDVCGNDTHSIAQKLYYAYTGNEQHVETTDPYTGLPVQTDTSEAERIGTEIYNSNWSLTKEGITFMYCPENGTYTSVTLPWSDISSTF